ncbi:MAG: type II secretion system minor pseudopilin GspI [Gammaproteobacteria bacterium]
MTSYRRKRGFTLLEVLVALAILGTAMYAGFSLLQKTINNANHIEEKILAHWVAQNALAEVDLAGQETEELNVEDGLVNMYGKEFLLNIATELLDESQVGETTRTKLTIHIRVSAADRPNNLLENIRLERIL